MKNINKISLLTIIIIVLIFSDNKLFAKKVKGRVRHVLRWSFSQNIWVNLKNLYKFNGQVRSQPYRPDKHLLNNGTILLQRGYL